MADIRIKDLTTTASSTASDDFIAVDGATNGTRKLNAYSPSFGGNATVAGTLTVSGGSVTLTGAAYSIFYADGSSGGNFTIRKAGVAYGTLYGNETNTVLDSAGSANLILQTGGATRGTFTSSGLTVNATTASTSTSTGALVVGGGVGVAGAIYAGGTIRVVGSSHTLRFRQDSAIIDFNNTAENAYVAGTISGNTLELKGNNGTGLTIGTTGNATFAGTLTVSAGSLVVDHVGSSSPTLSLSANGSVQSRFFANGSNTFLESYTNTPLILRTNQTTALTITSAQQVQVNATTASTSTSTGALVVSGGVGVAKDLYVGGTVITLQPGSGTTAPQQKIIGPSGATYGPSLFLDASASTSGKVYIVGSGLSGDNGGLGSFYVYDVSAATSVLKIVGGNTTLAGNITTAAPAGGTAAAWKLGTVASVSPTSPNRTIEVDIGGTIYYIHAKTTNN